MAIRRCWRCRASSTRAQASGENFGSRAMKNVVVDKIASIAQAAGLGHELRRDQRHPLRGRSAAGRRDPDEQVDLQHPRAHERPHGEAARGDVIVGALGHRQALFGYSGHVPDKVEAGDVLQVLNIGGVLGICDSINPDKGRPFDCRVLGAALQFPFSANGSACRRGSGIASSTRRRVSMRAACRWSRWPGRAWRRARLPPPARS